MKLENLLLIGVSAVMGFGIVWSMMSNRDEGNTVTPDDSKPDHDPARQRGGDTLD
jgi:hypothetical protein